MQVNISKWGNSLALRIPKKLADELGLSEGKPVDVRVENGTLAVSPARRKYILEEMLAGMTEENLHGETEWGPAVGRERIEE